MKRIINHLFVLIIVLYLFQHNKEEQRSPNLPEYSGSEMLSENTSPEIRSGVERVDRVKTSGSISGNETPGWAPGIHSSVVLPGSSSPEFESGRPPDWIPGYARNSDTALIMRTVPASPEDQRAGPSDPIAIGFVGPFQLSAAKPERLHRISGATLRAGPSDFVGPPLQTRTSGKGWETTLH